MIKNFKRECIRPANINLRLDKLFKIQKGKVIDWMENKRPEMKELKLPYTLIPKEYVIGKTIETFDVPPNISCLILPVSKCFRSGLIVTGIGTAEPGYKGELHLGIYNASENKVILRKEMELIKVVISKVEGNTIPLQSEWSGGKLI
jgi:deoxycytidine triphosphate deaminase